MKEEKWKITWNDTSILKFQTNIILFAKKISKILISPHFVQNKLLYSMILWDLEKRYFLFYTHSLTGWEPCQLHSSLSFQIVRLMYLSDWSDWLIYQINIEQSQQYWPTRSSIIFDVRNNILKDWQTRNKQQQQQQDGNTSLSNGALCA